LSIIGQIRYLEALVKIADCGY